MTLNCAARLSKTAAPTNQSLYVDTPVRASS